MGRAFEKRKHKMFARFSKMAKQFTRIGKEIAIAVKQGGPEPDNNPRLRMVMVNAKSLNMPKDRVDAAIKRASSKDIESYEEVVYEGYAPHGIAILVECATDNNTRTVANIRMYFSRSDGALGKTGSLDFLFERKGIFKLKNTGVSVEDLELDLIDFGAEEVFEDEGDIFVYTSFQNFGVMNKALEEKKIEVISTELQRIPTNTVELTEDQQKEVEALIEKIEDDDDVQAVYHNMA
ncbi:MAG: YebC/PmpR family DNA-binding transcriptional regulator [Bacteroidia bacterium]|nr:YebC/PmpR family DNA-binding transcriptional regulator [Bacteroidota bacterium]MBK9046065.1 YebC/PmpR family DNA-binding transcriptional regulator [Bacteroidota bacterium]MBP9081984.1 YebC/PmpR family DNA-binding transcriptional regulator [Bacteroidia bacterium]